MNLKLIVMKDLSIIENIISPPLLVVKFEIYLVIEKKNDDNLYFQKRREFIIIVSKKIHKDLSVILVVTLLAMKTFTMKGG